MRHASAVAAANGGEELTSMAISAATSAEDGWFGGGGSSAGCSGGQNGGSRSGVGRASGGGSGAVDAASNGVAGRAARQDLATAWPTSGDVRNVSTSSDEQRRSSGNLASINEKLLAAVDAAEPSDDEVICDRSSSDKRSLFWSAFTATLVPSKRVDAGEKRPIRRRNPFRQRKRRPNLSNVVEAQHENGAGAGVSEPVGSDSVGCGRSASVACEVSIRNPRPVNGNFIAPAGADLNCQSDAVSDGESAIPASRSSDLVTKSTISALNAAIPAPKSIIPGSKSVILASKSGIPTSKSRCGAFVAVNGCTDSDNYIWQRGRIFTSVPEDEDDDWTCELDADDAERTGLLERSASVPDAEAKVIRWTEKAAKAASMTSVADNSPDTSNVGDAVKRSHSSSSDASTGGGGSKLGKWSKSKMDLLVPSIKSLVTMTTNKLASSSSKASINCHRRSGCSGSTNNLFTSSSTSFSRFDVGALETPPKVETLRRNISLSCMSNGCHCESMNARSTDNLVGTGALTKKLRKCNTMVALTGGGGCAVSANPCGAVHLEPMQPVNRLRVSSQEFQAASRVCSRCSSLLSMAATSRYSLNSSYGFVPVSGVLCKVCLNEVPLKDSWTLHHCECSYCVDKIRFWRCEKRNGCKGRLHEIFETGELQEVQDHNHEANPARIEAMKVVTATKKRALDTMEPTCTILTQTTQAMSAASHGCLPRIDNIKRNIRRIRQKQNLAPHTPTSLETLLIPHEFQMYSPSPGITEPFLLFDSGPCRTRILIFGRQSVIGRLACSRYWFGDGTFSITPPLFYQVYAIFFEHCGTVHPALYGLLPNKTTGTYETFFKAVQQLVPNAQPQYFSTDYELSAINAFKVVFPITEIAGCFYHLMKNIKKKVSACGLTSAFNNEPSITLQVRMIGALSFVPEADVARAFEVLQDYVDERLEPIMNYFEDNYIGRPNRRGRKAPPFAIKWWNVHERTKNGDPRTNNYSEAAHRRLQTEMGVSHPSIWRFITMLQKVQKGRDIFFDETNRGEQQRAKKPKYVHSDRRLQQTVSNFAHKELQDYLRGVAYNLMF